MKRIISIILVAMLLISLSSCGTKAQVIITSSSDGAEKISVDEWDEEVQENHIFRNIVLEDNISLYAGLRDRKILDFSAIFFHNFNDVCKIGRGSLHQKIPGGDTKIFADTK